MLRRSEQYFRYPPNLNMLDLASLVTMYRNRGLPVKSAPGEYFACSMSFKLVREAKNWFGLHYAQTSWDALLTKDSQGYPLTEAEMNVLGIAAHWDATPHTRDFAEKNCGVTPQLGYMIVNDLKSFGFISEDENTLLSLTNLGEDALHGIAKRIYDKKFVPDMLLVNRQRYMKPEISDAPKTKGPQIDLF
jgi:hypothetical protein